MAPQKRKTQASAADSANSAEAPPRRSTRQKTASKGDASTKVEAASAKPVPAGAERPMVTKRRKTTQKQAAVPSAPGLVEPTTSSQPFTSFTISSTKPNGKATTCLRSHSNPEWAALIFTHGAGGDLSAAAMVNFSTGFASDLEIGLVMFQGSMNLKARAGWFDIVKQHESDDGYLKAVGGLAYGGRSMGARAAVIASEGDKDVKALVLVSYPLVSPAGDVRDKILLDLHADIDVLFISGDNDSMCDLDALDELRGRMKANTWRVMVQGADHGMNIRGGKRLKDGTEKVGSMTGQVAANWLLGREKGKKEMEVSWDGEAMEVRSSGWKGSEPEDQETTKKEQAKPKDEGAGKKEKPKGRKTKK